MEADHHGKKPNHTIAQALIDLYLNVKVRSTEDIENYTEERLEEERQTLLQTDPLVIIEYIKTSIEILLNLREEEQKSQPPAQKPSADESLKSDADPPQDYEQIIQKLEAETRMHIRVPSLVNHLRFPQIEQQLKLHIDTIQAKLEDDEKETERNNHSVKVLYLGSHKAENGVGTGGNAGETEKEAGGERPAAETPRRPAKTGRSTRGASSFF